MSDPVLQAEVKRLTRQLGSFRRSTREEAKRRLDELGPEAVPGIVAAMTPFRGYYVVRFLLLSSVSIAVCRCAVQHFVPHDGIVSELALALAGGVSFVPAVRFEVVAWRRAAAERLSQVSDPRSLPVLLAAVTTRGFGTSVQRSARQALVRILETPQDTDGHLPPLARKQIGALLGLPHADVVAAALRWIARTGATHHVDRVRDIATRRAGSVTPASSDPRVRAVALEVLPELERLAGLADTESVLLRPADAPAGEVLLRPAQPAGESDAALLLRASGANPEAAGPGD